MKKNFSLKKSHQNLLASNLDQFKNDVVKESARFVGAAGDAEEADFGQIIFLRFRQIIIYY
ncbi:MAG: hypothetical protein JNM68_09675 [Dinghuibacter sp.]|nr:hypothetical protein [Dinghuibacter sp.]